MTNSNIISVRVKDEKLFTLISGIEKGKATEVNKALEQYFLKKEKPELFTSPYLLDDEIDDDVYNLVYTNIFNIEIIPLELKNRFLEEKLADEAQTIVALEDDKEYFKQRFDALLLVKTPLISRIKMKLLNRQR